MRYLIFILIAMIVVTLGVALYGWYSHLRDDEDYTYSPENPVNLTPARTAGMPPAAGPRQRDHAGTTESFAHNFSRSGWPLTPPLIRLVINLSASAEVFSPLVAQNQADDSQAYCGGSKSSS